MTEQRPGHELEFIELLAMYDESLAAGEATVSTDVRLSAGLVSDSKLVQRFEKLRDCLHLLETDRRQQQLNVVDPLTDTHIIQLEPRQIGRFRILRKLGAGGFGIVYLAEDPILQRKVAIKIPRRETLITPDLQRRFVRESQIVARLTHRHLVPIFDAGQAGPISYQITAYCGGGSLAEWLRVGGSSAKAPSPPPIQRRLPVDVAVELIIGLAEGVHFAHEHGILHRDLKPANILLHPSVERDSGSLELDASKVPGEKLCAVFQPMIADFGLAKLFDTRDDLSTSAMPTMDHDSSSDFQRTTLAGTPQYMAPEQISADTRVIGKRTDIYGLGTILYEILTGTPVFAKDSVENLRSRIETEPPRPLRELRAEIPRDLEAICLRCLEKLPTARYATAQELVEDLRAFQKGEPVAARPWPWHEQIAKWTRRRPAVAALVLISAVLTTGLMGFGAWHLNQLDNEMTSKVFPRAKDPEISEFRTRAMAFSPQGHDLVGGIHYLREGVYRSHDYWRARIELSEQVVSTGHRTSPMIARLEQWKPGTAGEEFNIVFSDDGQRVALATLDDPPHIEILDWQNGALIANIANLPDLPRTMAFEPSGAGLVYTIDVPAPTENGQRGSPVNPRIGPRRFELRRSDFKTNSSETLIADAVRSIWSLSPAEGTGESIERAENCNNKKGPTSRWVIGDEGGLISLLSPESAPPYRELTGHQPSEAWGVAFSPDGSRLYSVGDDTCLRVWNSTTLEQTAVGKEHTALVSCLAVSPDGSWVATGSYDNRAIIWNAKTLEPHAVLTGHTNHIKSLAFASDSKTLATAARDETIKLWNVTDGQLTTTTEPDGATVLGMVFTSANSFITGNFKGFLFARSPNRKPEIIRAEWQEVHCLSLAPVELQCPAPPANSLEAREDAASQILTAGKGDLLLVGCRHGRFQLLHIPTRRVWFEHSYPGIDIRTAQRDDPHLARTCSINQPYRQEQKRH